MVATFQREPHAFADDKCARAKLLAKHAETANLRVRRNSPDDPGNGSAVAENILALPLYCFQLQPVVNHGQIIGQGEPFQHGVRSIDA